MKMKYIDAYNRHVNLMKLSKKMLPRKISVAIAHNIVKLEDEMKTIGDQPEDIANRYACKDDEGNFVMSEDGKGYEFATPEDRKAYSEELQDFLESELEVSVSLFDETELDKCEEDNNKFDILTPLEIAYLDWMIKDYLIP